MGNPFTEIQIDNYNSNPPSDDGSQTPENKITWSKIKEKLGDPVKAGVETLNTNILAAFAIVAGGVNEQSGDYTVQTSDQGKIIAMTGGDEVTMLSAASAATPFLVTVLNLTGGDLTLTPNGSETIDGESSITIPDDMGITLDTNGSNWFSKGQNYKQTYSGPTNLIRQPGGYLTLTTGVPVLTEDVIAGTSVYYTPDVGAQAPFSDGSAIAMEEFSQLTLTLHSNHVASNIYDVFLFKESGVQMIGTGPAWNTATAGSGARGTGTGTTELERWKGFLVNKNSMTVRNGASTYTVGAREGIYVGSIFMDGTNGQISCHRSYGQNRKWGVWNYYNRKRIILKAGDSTSSWSYNSSTIRQSRAQTGNRATVFCGLAEEIIEASFKQNVEGTADDELTLGVGVNSTTTFSGNTGILRCNGGEGMTVVAKSIIAPVLGISNINCLEQANSGTVDSLYGGEDDMQLTVEWRG